MNNPKNPNSHNSEDNLNQEKKQSYGDGYVDGNTSKRRVQNEVQTIRDQNNTAGGLILGFFIAAVLGFSGLVYFFWGRQPATTKVIVLPTPAVSQQPEKQTTIIEKTNTIERVPVIVPAPQQSAPNVNVKIDVPRPQTPNNPPPAVTPPNTTINIAPPASSVETPKSTSSPNPSNSSSQTQESPNTGSVLPADRNSTDSNP
ncbi:hypothetical protein FJR38_10455 [Anabaena sp. UHCC 0253]|uniref:hypothetical protein n=1 Tax=Anabaena sp. UHCC 0253 TaxID=2590019 RepID=UPI0014459DA5|nr:hypothetical protein [Anabaena sp. UHCC 0253]MTJ53037.1 hypothetical protein [Anabaena sp. UHCC 0253]